jgi:segregation and condensation protein B
LGVLFKNETKAIVESLLFVSNEPLSLDKMTKIVGVSKSNLKDLITEMVEEFEENSRGIQLLEVGEGYKLATKPQYYQFIEKLYKPNITSLSQAALETLSIIAYKQPITKAEIEILRGVKSDGVIAKLLERNIIEEKGRKDVPGKPIIYGTGNNFLNYFGLKDLNELPEVK